MRFSIRPAIFAGISATLLASPAVASFHLMQIEQVIGGVNGDPTAQAIQLRMRADFENFVSQARIRVHDAAGANPIVVINMTTNVANGTTGDRVLIASANFFDYTAPGVEPDFTMTNLIPVSYLAAGSLTFESDTGIIYWRLSWGGAGYTGSHAGNVINDPNSNFGPAFAGPLPTGGHQALLFQGAATAQSNSNSTDYALTPGAATFTNNATAPFLVTDPGCNTCAGDVDGDNAVTALDIQQFTNCTASSSLILRTCGCADEDFSGVLDQADVDAFVDAVLNDETPTCFE
ncbi:MAG TPA: hypothetical protein VJZ71_03070 [Phycisphaerae bacterium]|nr:hypothetical protein [Phycisphaerae bacterium]